MNMYRLDAKTPSGFLEVRADFLYWEDLLVSWKAMAKVRNWKTGSALPTEAVESPATLTLGTREQLKIGWTGTVTLSKVVTE